MERAPFSDSFTRISLYTLLGLAPLPLGLVQPWALGLFEFLVSLVFLFWLISSRAAGPIRLKSNPLFLPIFFLLVYCLFRMIPPFPDFAIPRLLAWASLIPAETLNQFQLLLTAFVIFFLFSQLSRSRDLRNFSLVFLIAITCYSFFGLIQYNLKEYLLFGYQLPRRPVGNLSGPYINPDHFAALLELAIPVSLALLLSMVISRREPRPGDTLLYRIRRRLNEEGYEKSVSQFFLLAFILIALLTTLIFTASRAGITAALIGLVFYLNRIRARRRRRKISRILIPVVLFTLFVGLWIGLEPVFEKFSSTEYQLASFNGRIPFWKAGLQIASDYPLFGTGPGTTPWVYPHYRIPESPDNVQVDHLHNEYLEFLSENGVVGLGLLLWILVTYFLTWRGNPPPSASYRRRSHLDFLIPAFQAGILSLLIHAGMDFFFRIPANLFICAAFLALSSSPPEKPASPTAAPATSPPPAGRKLAAVPLFLVAGILLVGSLRLGLGGFFHLSIDQKTFAFLSSQKTQPPAQVDLPQVTRQLISQVKFDPLNSDYRFELGYVYYRMAMMYYGRHTGWNSNWENWESFQREAIREFQASLRLNPLHQESRLALATLLFQSSAPAAPERGEALRLFSENRRFDPQNGDSSLAVGRLYLYSWNDLTPEEKTLALDSLRSAFLKIPRVFPGLLGQARVIIGDYETLSLIIPDTAWYHAEAAKVFRASGQDDLAEREAELAKKD
ncbi:MAG: O-antigen ligase family protein [bacterium]|nr:O-antigen ligase family protein [bacterium]